MILSWLLVLYMAVKNRKINPKVIIFHSDRGAQFTSKVFRVWVGVFISDLCLYRDMGIDFWK